MKKVTRKLVVLFLAFGILTVLFACGKSYQKDSATTSTYLSEETSRMVQENGSDSDSTTKQKTHNEDYEINITAINGPTGMGMAYLNQASDNGKTACKYNISYSNAPDEVSAGLITGEIDIAAIPVNLASVLFNKTEGDVLCLAVNTLGVLYVIENGESVNSISDLEGKSMIAGGQGSTPEYILNYVLEGNGLKDKVDIEYVSEFDEAVTALASGKTNIVMLPEPKVTAALSQIEGTRTALDLTKEWDRICDTELVQGVLVIRKGFIDKLGDKSSEVILSFMDEYQKSVEYTINNPKEASEIIAEYGIVPKVALAFKAIPNCNMVCMVNEKMENAVTAMLNVLYEANPKSVGGTVPGHEMFLYVE